VQISSIGVKLLREVIKASRIFSIGRTTSTLRGFTTFAYSTSAETNDCEQLTSFDTDSSFLVCNNLGTGHICNNKTLFAGDLVPSIFEIGSATGMLTPTLMDTVILWLTDNKGEKHLFVLNDVNYLPNSPVNLLSLGRLAEVYPDYAGNPDRNGTGICSGFDTRTVFWDREKFKKTFQTTSSGLPECLFNSGYSRLDMFSTTISNFYNDTINWAFASKEKLHKMANNLIRMVVPSLKMVLLYMSLRMRS
jgi:hypothetical protein